MRSVGSTLLFFSIGTFVLDFFGFEFIIMSWIYNWGMAVALSILGTMFVLGGVLFFLGGRTAETAAE